MLREQTRQLVAWCDGRQVPDDAMTAAVDAANVSESCCSSSSPLHLLRNACSPYHSIELLSTVAAWLFGSKNLVWNTKNLTKTVQENYDRVQKECVALQMLYATLDLQFIRGYFTLIHVISCLSIVQPCDVLIWNLHHQFRVTLRVVEVRTHTIYHLQGWCPDYNA